MKSPGKPTQPPCELPKASGGTQSREEIPTDLRDSGNESAVSVLDTAETAKARFGDAHPKVPLYEDFVPRTLLDRLVSNSEKKREKISEKALMEVIQSSQDGTDTDWMILREEPELHAGDVIEDIIESKLFTCVEDLLQQAKAEQPKVFELEEVLSTLYWDEQSIEESTSALLKVGSLRSDIELQLPVMQRLKRTENARPVNTMIVKRKKVIA